jgi:hypothetical protein
MKPAVRFALYTLLVYLVVMLTLIVVKFVQVVL